MAVERSVEVVALGHVSRYGLQLATHVFAVALVVGIGIVAGLSVGRLPVELPRGGYIEDVSPQPRAVVLHGVPQRRVGIIRLRGNELCGKLPAIRRPQHGGCHGNDRRRHGGK